MTNPQNIQHGDEIEVTLKGRVGSVRKDYYLLEDADHAYSLVRHSAVVNTTKKHKVFGPGDTVRSKTVDTYFYSIGNIGYFSHQTGKFHRWDRNVSPDSFTSDRYEEVNLKVEEA